MVEDFARKRQSGHAANALDEHDLASGQQAEEAREEEDDETAGNTGARTVDEQNVGLYFQHHRYGVEDGEESGENGGQIALTYVATTINAVHVVCGAVQTGLKLMQLLQTHLVRLGHDVLSRPKMTGVDAVQHLYHFHCVAA